MERRLIDALERHPQVHDWTVRHQVGAEAQVYLAGSALEAVRSTSREAYQVDCFHDHVVDGEPMRGTATLPVTRDEIDRFPELLEEAIFMAGLVHNPPWPLPEPVVHPEVALADASVADPAEAVAVAHDAMDEVMTLTSDLAGVQLSAGELFVSTVQEEIANSRGLRGEARSTRVLLELALRSDGEREAEFFRQLKARRIDDLHLPELVSHGAQLARDATRARAPRTRVGPVVISDMALEQLMSNVVSQEGAYLAQTSAATAYAGLSGFEIGEPVYGGVEPSGDLLTLRANARRPYGVLSYRFDTDGLPAQDLLLIENGILRARSATQRYAHYMSLPATGRPGVAEISPGPTPLRDLLAPTDGQILHVVAFSAPNIDAVSGDFGMEIRIGYAIGPAGTEPITGGSVSGNLFEAMAAARFSAETAEHASVAGPRAIRFERLQIAGEEA